MKLAIIAAYNEEDTIGSIVIKTKKHVDKVLVIDDGSKDKTAEIAKAAGAEVIQHIQNGGKGAALKTGFEAAEKLNPDVVVCLDADAQHDPDYIPRIIEPILSKEAEMVIASRYLNKDHTKKVPRYRRFGLWVLTKTNNLGSEVKTTDTQCGFRAFSGDILGKFGFHQTGFSVESEMFEDAKENNIKIKEVPFIPKYDVLNSSTEKPMKHGLGVLNFIIRTVKDRHPLLFFGISGLILLFFGLVFGIWCLNSYFTQNYIPFGPAIAASILIIMGTFCVFAGLILNSIAGMISGLTKLNRGQETKLFEDTNNKTILTQESLNLKQSPNLYSNPYNQKIPGLTVLNYNHGNNFYGGINGQINSEFPSIEDNLENILPGNIVGQRIPRLLILNNINKNNEINEPNGKVILKPTVLMDENRDEIAFEENHKDNIQNPVILINNNRREMILEDNEDKNIHR